MRITFKYALGDKVIEKSTDTKGRIVMVGADDIGHCYEILFERPIMGRKRHWKRESEIKAAPASKKKKSGK